MASLKALFRIFAVSACVGPVLAAPMTYQFEGPKDTVCIVADYEIDPRVPAPDSNGWEALNRDTAWQNDWDGLIQYDVRYTRNFDVELEGVPGVGWVNLYYSHSDYPNSSNYSFDPQVSFSFRKGDRLQNFGTFSLFQDYDGVGAIPFGMGQGMRSGESGLSLDRYQGDVWDTTRVWFVLTKITNGIAECPGKEKAWKYKVEGPGEEPGCRERPDRRPGHGPGRGGRLGNGHGR